MRTLLALAAVAAYVMAVWHARRAMDNAVQRLEQWRRP